MSRAQVALLTFAVLAIAAAASSEDVGARKLLQAPRAANACTPSKSGGRAVYIDDDDNSCQACGRMPNMVAWCCSSDDTMSPTQCKAAGTQCCRGAAYIYQKRDDDNEIETEELDDVWCVPNTCRANFQAPPLSATTTGR